MASSQKYGKRLIPQILDDLAAAEPDRIVYSLAKSSDISKGFRDVSASAFAKAVDKTAWWLHNEIGKSTSSQTVGYIGPHDLRHILLTYASNKAGYQPLFLSPKNSTEGALAVLEAADCNIWVRPRGQAHLSHVQDFLKKRPMKILDIPEVDYLLDAETTEPYPFNKTFDEAARDSFCVLHTSGSTGLPKPIAWSNALIGTMDAVRLLPPADGDNGMPPWTSEWKEGDRIYSSFPMSHGAGIIMNILIPSLFGLPCVMGPVGVIPNLNLVESLADHAKIDIWSMVPSLVDELGETPDILAKFNSAKFICASGGPISPTSSAKVNEVVRVLNLTGTTEGLFIGNLVVDREDYLYFAFHPYSGFEFKEIEPGVYEHWVRRNEHWDLFQGIFHTFPSLQEINLKDLYVKHPTKPDHWMYKGRSDDIVVLSNGYKISPLDTEALITTHPAISGCLMIGTAKPQAGLLIELKDPDSRSDELFDSIWSFVQKANALSLHKDQLLRDYIMFAEADKPFVRTDKGTVKRRATLQLYSDYIDRFYDSRSEESDPQVALEVDVTSVDSIIAAVKQILVSLSPAFQHVEPDADLFDLGLDSLLVFRVVRVLKTATGLQEQIGPRHLYAHPTIAGFSSVVAHLAAGEGATNGTDSELGRKAAKMKEMVEEHKSRQTRKMNEFDMIMTQVYIEMLIYIPLRKGVSFEHAFSVLQRGLLRTFELLPTLDGKLTGCSDQEPGYKTGQSQIVPADTPSSGSSAGPRQLAFRDLSGVLPSFGQLRDAGFPTSAYTDDLLLDTEWFPVTGSDLIVAQANFIEGGCLLATGFQHQVFDGTGLVIAIKAWAECCRFVEGDESATCSWLDPESMNHDLPGILWELEGYGRPPQEVDPGTWGFLTFDPPEELRKSTANVKSNLPPPPVIAPTISFPIVPSKQDRHLTTKVFKIPAAKMEQLKQEVAADPDARDKGLMPSASDIVQALLWRTMINARYRAATECYGRNIAPDETCMLELPFDCRPHFSSLLPSSYLGNMVVVSRPTMPLDILLSPETSIGRIALLIREAAARIRPSLVHDAFTLLKTVPDYTDLRYASVSLDGYSTAIANNMLFPTMEVSFGGKLFENEGALSAVRLLKEGLNTAVRLGVILPMNKDGGVELLLGTFPEEFEKLKENKEFAKYATFVA